MSDFSQTIETTKSNLIFHRKMVHCYFALLVITVFSYAAIEITADLRNHELASKLASALRNVPSTIDIKLDGAPRYLDFPSDATVEISADSIKKFTNSNVSISLPLLTVNLFLIAAIYGLLRHHLRRVNLAEDRIFFLERLVPIMGNDVPLNKEVLDMWLGNEVNKANGNEVATSKDEPPIHPGYEILEKSIDMLSDIKKSVGSKFKS
ncbi:hypothetical protein TMEC54S_03812 [Thauera mechernichensis]